MITPRNGFVVVKRIHELSKYPVSVDAWEVQFTTNSMVKVLAVCNTVGDIPDLAIKVWSQEMLYRMSLQCSTMPEVKVPVEVSEGDMCIASYIVTREDVWKEYYIGDDVWCLPYSALHARVNSDGSLYPLNGRLLVRPLAIDVVNVLDMEIGHIGGEIVAQGALVEKYSDGKRGDIGWEGIDTVGSFAIFKNQKAAVKIQSIFNQDGGNPLYFIFRNDICGFLQNAV